MGRQSKLNGSFSSYDDENDCSSSRMIERGRVVMFHGDVNEASISNAITQLLQLADMSSKPINLIISTYGGAIDEMFGLCDTIKLLPCDLHTIALGKVMSAGVLLLASGTKGHRLIGRSTRVMMHTISGGIWGSTLDLVTHADEVKRMQQQYNDTLCQETKMTREQIAEIMKSGLDYFLSPEDVIRYGIADRIIGAQERVQ